MMKAFGKKLKSPSLFISIQRKEEEEESIRENKGALKEEEESIRENKGALFISIQRKEEEESIRENKGGILMLQAGNWETNSYVNYFPAVSY